MARIFPDGPSIFPEDPDDPDCPVAVLRRDKTLPPSQVAVEELRDLVGAWLPDAIGVLDGITTHHHVDHRGYCAALISLVETEVSDAIMAIRRYTNGSMGVLMYDANTARRYLVTGSGTRAVISRALCGAVMTAQSHGSAIPRSDRWQSIAVVSVMARAIERATALAGSVGALPSEDHYRLWDKATDKERREYLSKCPPDLPVDDVAAAHASAYASQVEQWVRATLTGPNGKPLEGHLPGMVSAERREAMREAIAAVLRYGDHRPGLTCGQALAGYSA